MTEYAIHDESTEGRGKRLTPYASADATLTELRRRVHKGASIPMSVRPRPTDADSNPDRAVLHVDEHGLDRGPWA